MFLWHETISPSIIVMCTELEWFHSYNLQNVAEQAKRRWQQFSFSAGFLGSEVKDAPRFHFETRQCFRLCQLHIDPQPDPFPKTYA